MPNLQAAVLVLLGALLAIGAPAFAAGPNLIANGQFHAGTAIETSIELDTASTQLAPWRVTAGHVDVVGSFWQTVAGSNSVELGGVPAGSLAQTVSLQPGRRYELQFWLAGDPDGEPRVKRLRVAIGSLVQEFPFDTGGLSHSALGFQRVRIGFTAARPSTAIVFSNVYDQYFWGPVIAGVQLNAIGDGGAPPPARNVPHHGVRPRPRPLHRPSPHAIVHRALPPRPAHHPSPRPIVHRSRPAPRATRAPLPFYGWGSE